jgi:hypothetical protein
VHALDVASITGPPTVQAMLEGPTLRKLLYCRYRQVQAAPRMRMLDS